MACKIVIAKPDDFELWPNNLSCHFLIMARTLLYNPECLLGSSCEHPHSFQGPYTKCSVTENLISKACALYSNSAVRVYDAGIQKYGCNKLIAVSVSPLI